MTGYEYKVVPAPAKGLKAPGIKGAEARFANALEHRMNEMSAEGWEYQRADILPSEERQGLTSTQTVYRTVLVFRRPRIAAPVGDDVIAETVEEPAEEIDTPEAPAEETPEPQNAQSDRDAEEDTAEDAPEEEKDKKPAES